MPREEMMGIEDFMQSKKASWVRMENSLYGVEWWKVKNFKARRPRSC
jgi:hypothetical protein